MCARGSLEIVYRGLHKNGWTTRLNPWLHVQLLHAIILGSGRSYRCQSVCDWWRYIGKVVWRIFHQTLSLAATLRPHEYFRTRLKVCKYCMQELQRVACNNCTCNHGFWATVCKTVRRMLSVRCPVLSCLSWPLCLQRSCTVAKRLDGSRPNFAHR